ncbi:ABC transporter ATP-binding protein [Microbacterium sp. NPDC058021]|uniref:ABC transporter ATP-binding protein n=1 Tax=Microbacterium sp. NPDC058021 TaxID=3346306 RepID=UPI0036DC16C8
MDEPIINVEGLTLRYGRRTIISDLHLQIGVGITALLGPNGAGKSTLLNALSQPRRIASGEISLAGIPLESSRDSQRRFQSRVGFMPQHWQHFPSFTAKESVEYVGWLKLVPRSDLQSHATRSLDRVGLLDKRDELVARLSGGTRQRVGLAEALVNDPELILLDEPTVGLDPAQRAAFRAALQSMKSEKAVLLSTHLTDDVAAIADRVLVMAAGSIWFDGSPAELAGLSSERGDFSVRLERGYLNVLEGEAASLT